MVSSRSLSSLPGIAEHINRSRQRQHVAQVRHARQGSPPRYRGRGRRNRRGRAGKRQIPTVSYFGHLNAFRLQDMESCSRAPSSRSSTPVNYPPRTGTSVEPPSPESPSSASVAKCPFLRELGPPRRHPTPGRNALHYATSSRAAPPPSHPSPPSLGVRCVQLFLLVSFRVTIPRLLPRQ